MRVWMNWKIYLLREGIMNRTPCLLCSTYIQKYVERSSRLSQRVHSFVSRIGEVKEFVICDACWRETLRSWAHERYSSWPPNDSDVWGLFQRAPDGKLRY